MNDNNKYNILNGWERAAMPTLDTVSSSLYQMKATVERYVEDQNGSKKAQHVVFLTYQYLYQLEAILAPLLSLKENLSHLGLAMINESGSENSEEQVIGPEYAED